MQYKQIWKFKSIEVLDLVSSCSKNPNTFILCLQVETLAKSAAYSAAYSAGPEDVDDACEEKVEIDCDGSKLFVNTLGGILTFSLVIVELA